MHEIRCHFSMFITRTLKSTWAVIAALVVFIIQSGVSSEVMDEINHRQLLVFAGLLALFLVNLLFNYIRWRRTFISLDGDNLIVDRRTINKNKTTVKLANISTVNLRQGIFEKIFRTYRLQLDINSTANADKTDFDLVFKREQAKLIREQIINREGQQPQTAQSADSQPAIIAKQQEESRLICSFGVADVIRHCFLGLSIGSLIGALTGFVIWFISSGIGDGKVSWLPIIVVVFPAVYQLLRPLFLYQHFRVSKRGNYLDVSYGLISTHDFSLPLDKTNAIIIKRPALARMFNLCCGEIANVGMGSTEDNQAPLFCLLTTPKKMYEIISAIAPEYAVAALDGAARPQHGSPKSALLPIMLRYAIWGIVLAAIAFFFHFVILGIIIFAFMLLCSYLSWRTKEIALLDDKISISSGVFSKRNITADYGRLQRLVRKSNPISRRYSLSQGSVSILAMAGHQNNPIGYFPSAYFDRIEYEIMRSVSVKNTQQAAAYINGYPDGSFQPDAPILRSQAAKMFCLAGGLTVEENVVPTFTDVNSSDWFAPFVVATSKALYIEGYPDGSFGANGEISRAEFIVMVCRMMGLDKSDVAAAYTDLDHWAAGYINAVYAAGWLADFAEEEIKPDQAITRAEAVLIINLATERNDKEILTAGPEFNDVPNTDARYDAIKKASSIMKKDSEQAK